MTMPAVSPFADPAVRAVWASLLRKETVTVCTDDLGGFLVTWLAAGEPGGQLTVGVPLQDLQAGSGIPPGCPPPPEGCTFYARYTNTTGCWCLYICTEGERQAWWIVPCTDTP